MLALFYIALLFNYKFITTDAQNLNIYLAVKASLSLLSTIIATGIYIRWRIKLYDKQAKIEQTLKQTQIDIARASWLVETLLEWRKADNGAIPRQLLASLSRNLFEFDDKATDTDINPADQLASALFGSASRLKLNAGPAELEYERKNLKDLKEK